MELKKINKAIIQEAEKLAGLEFTDSERELMVEGLNGHLEKYEELRQIPLDNGIAPAIQFNPILPGMSFQRERKPLKMSEIPLLELPSDIQELAFWPVTHLSQLVKNRKISSVELTKMYLERLRKYDPQLKCVITLTEELALKQAERADAEIADGQYRGPLHGIPWGAKDLLSTKGYKTTWGPCRTKISSLTRTLP